MFLGLDSLLSRVRSFSLLSIAVLAVAILANACARPPAQRPPFVVVEPLPIALLAASRMRAVVFGPGEFTIIRQEIKETVVGTFEFLGGTGTNSTCNNVTGARLLVLNQEQLLCEAMIKATAAGQTATLFTEGEEKISHTKELFTTTITS
jgi:hypothetical protein